MRLVAAKIRQAKVYLPFQRLKDLGELGELRIGDPVDCGCLGNPAVSPIRERALWVQVPGPHAIAAGQGVTEYAREEQQNASRSLALMFNPPPDHLGHRHRQET